MGSRLPLPPCRRIKRNGICLTENQNSAFRRYARALAFDRLSFGELIDEFVKQTALCLKGRTDKDGRAKRPQGTSPCGYVFISDESFLRGHEALLHFDPKPRSMTLRVVFRMWDGVIPCSQSEWDSLKKIGKENRDWRFCELTGEEGQLQRVVELAMGAKQKFEEAFDLEMCCPRPDWCDKAHIQQAKVK
jgi:hypothetical protein